MNALMAAREKKPRVDPKSVEKLYTTAEAGILLGGVDAATVYRMCLRKDIGYTKVGNRYKLSQKNIDTYLKRNRFELEEEKEE